MTDEYIYTCLKTVNVTEEWQYGGQVQNMYQKLSDQHKNREKLCISINGVDEIKTVS